MPLPTSVGTGRLRAVTSTVPTNVYAGLVSDFGFENQLLATTLQGTYSFTRGSAGRKFVNGVYSDVAQDLPRFSEIGVGVTGQLPTTLLIEPTATQLLSQVLDISNSAWTKNQLGTPTAIADLAGGTAAWRLLETATVNTTHEFTQNVTLADTTTYTASVFVKANGRGFLKIACTNKANSVYFANFNLSTGAVGTVAGQVYTTVTDFANGWYKVSMSFPSSTGATQPVVKYQLANADNVTSYTGSTSAGVDVYHPQVEAGFFATSPISNTLGTRQKDLFSFPAAGNLTLGDMTICFWAITPWNDANQGLGYFFGNAVSAALNRVSFQKLATTFRILVNGGTASGLKQLDVTSSGLWSANVWHHVAVVIFADGTSKLYIDGVDVGGTPSTSGTWSSRTALGTTFYLGGDYNGNSQMVGRLWRNTVYGRAKTAAEIASIYAQERATLNNANVSRMDRPSRRNLTPTSNISVFDTTLEKLVTYNTTLKRWTNADGSEIAERKAEVIGIANSLTNPSVNGPTTYSINTAHYDSTVSRSAGSGSVRFDAQGELMDGTAFVTIADNTQPLTISFYMLSDTKGAEVLIQPRPRIDTGAASSTDASYCANTDVGMWQECVHTLIPNTVKPGANQISFKVSRTDANGGHVWIDDLKILPGDRCFASAPATGRATFNGPKIKVDGYGNFQRLVSGVWTPWFPFGIHQVGPQSSSNFQTLYASKGFDVVWDNSIFGSSNTAILAAAAGATDATYAPNGMMAIAELKSYGLSSDPTNYHNDTLLLSKLQTLVAHTNYDDNFFCFYMDNEMRDQWLWLINCYNLIRSVDSKKPIFMHDHQPCEHRLFSGSPINFTGTYITDISRNEMQVADLVEGNPFPVAMGQLTDCLSSGQFRSDFYRAIIMGARGIKVYRDNVSTDSTATHVSEAYTSGTITQCRDEVDAMLAAEIIQAPHWMDPLVTIDKKQVAMGVRLVAGGKFYILLANPDNDTKTITLTFSGTGIGVLKDFHNSLTTVANVTARQATFDIGPYARYVLEGS